MKGENEKWHPGFTNWKHKKRVTFKISSFKISLNKPESVVFILMVLSNGIHFSKWGNQLKML